MGTRLVDKSELQKRAGIITEYGDEDQFQRDPRDYALQLVEEGLVDPKNLLVAALKYMSHDDVRGMLDANELSPRFDERY